MKKLLALLFALALLGACAAPALVDYAAETTEQTTTAEPTTMAAPTREWPGVPQAYWAVLDTFLYEVSYDHWLSWFRSTAAFAIADINGDGAPNLILSLEHENIDRIYTMIDNEPVQLADFSAPIHRSVRIAEDGTIFYSGGSRYFVAMSSSRLQSGAAELTNLSSWHVLYSPIIYDADLGDYIRPARHYRGSYIDENKQSITAEEFYAIQQQYYNPPNPMQFNFIPLEQ